MNREQMARLRPLERKALLDELAALLSSGELHLGDAVRILRSAVLGMDRESFARAVRLSASALARLEDNPKANPTIDTLNRIFAPFGGHVGLIFRHEEPAPPDERQKELREALRGALAKSRRKRRRHAPEG
jgi:transcriptional regulator with XRE-family HTH domain